MTVRERQVFDKLADERSCEVFYARRNAVNCYSDLILYYESVDFLFDVMPEFSRINEDYKGTQLNDFIEEFSMRKNGFVFYGASKTSVLIKEKLLSVNPSRFDSCVGVWDINPHIAGKDVLEIGIPVAPPPPQNADISKYLNAEVLVTQLSPVIVSEIITHLMSIGFAREQIITLEGIAPTECVYADFDQFQYSEEEIFVDGGCLNFNSSLEFLHRCPNAKKIYAFEPNKNVLDRIKRNIELSGFGNVCLIEAGLWSENTTLNFSVPKNFQGQATIEGSGTESIKAVSFDSVAESDENITLIKLDIEGAELEALKGMSETIRRCKPKLAICIYHKAHDYIDIPEYILSLVPEYEIYMRHYSDTYLESIMFACI